MSLPFETIIEHVQTQTRAFADYLAPFLVYLETNTKQLVEMRVSADTLIARFLALKAHDDAQEKATASMSSATLKEVVRAALHARLNRENADSFATDSGTAYKSTLLNPKVADHNMYLDFCLENEAGTEMLVLGAPQVDAVRRWMQEHEEQLPPGVVVNPVTRVNIKAS